MTVMWQAGTQRVCPWFCVPTSDACPAKAGPTDRAHIFSGTGFSREEARVSAVDFAVSL